ncbi:MAG TPA: LysM peptidoglycan-binding domain-containing protein [Jiangellaceae bacterium]|nr:LysM peptidoglycan-binding domain-containing protein [Jiangellaceae bacterium]
MTTLTLVPPARPVGRVAPVPSAARPRPVQCERSHAADLRGSRLSPRGRLVVALLWIVLAAAGAFAFLRPGAGSTEVGQADTTTVVVEAGDTMWALARSLDTDADPRVVVDAIVELNGLRSGADIHPGDVLVVPLLD